MIHEDLGPLENQATVAGRGALVRRSLGESTSQDERMISEEVLYFSGGLSDVDVADQQLW